MIMRHGGHVDKQLQGRAMPHVDAAAQKAYQVRYHHSTTRLHVTETAEPRIERLTAVLGRVGISRSTLYARIAAGLFPPPIQLGSPRIIGWLAADVTAAINDMVRASRPEETGAP